MSAPPLVSVILPVYNSASTLARAAHSILRQTLTDFELIIIDDGSSDDSYEVARRLRDDRIRLYRNPRNLGVSSTRNRGLKLMRGAVMAPMDADDFCRPNRLADTWAYLKAHPAVGICGGRARWEGWSRVPFTLPLPGAPESVRAYMLLGVPFHHDTLLVRRSLLDTDGVRYPETWHAGEDYGFFHQALRAGARAANLDRVLVAYHASPAGISHRRGREATERRLEGIRYELGRLVRPRLAERALGWHAHIGNGGGAADIAELHAYRKWLLALENRNRSGQVYSENGLAEALGMVWFRVCRNTAHAGVPAWRAWWTARWRSHYRPLLSELASFWGSMALAAVSRSRRRPQGGLMGS